MRHIVVADDLTGAVESLAAFARKGVGSVVMRWTEGGPGATVDCTGGALGAPGIVAIASASRNMSEDAAIRRIGEIRDWVVAHGHGVTLIKKIDSGLRGAIATELRLLVRTGECTDGSLPPLLVVPALPAQGRSTISGVQFMHGLPVSDSDSGTDVLSPVRSSVVSDHLPEGYVVTELSLDVVRSEFLGPSLANTLSPGAAVIVDAETEDDLRAIAHAFRGSSDVVVVASSGFISAMAGAQISAQPLEELSGGGGPTLVLSASVSAAMHRQLEWIESSADDIAVARLNPRMLIDPHQRERELERARGILERSLRAGRDIVIALELNPVSGVESAPKTLLRDSAAINAALGFLAAIAVRSSVPLRNIVLVGGDTADAVCHALDVRALRVMGEIAAGTTCFQDYEGRTEVLNFVARSGGFGAPRSLSDLIRTLSKEGNGGSHYVP